MDIHKQGSGNIISLARDNIRLVNQLKESNTPICLKPWTSFEEQTVKGDIRVCCWSKVALGRMRGEEDFDAIWGGEKLKIVRALMLKGEIHSICEDFCPVLNKVFDFDKQLLYEYSEDELYTFNHKFLENRKLMMESILEGRVGLGAYPLRMRLYPSNKCNLKCVMCTRLDEEKSAEEQWYFGNFFRGLKVYLEELKVYGGEPFFCELSKEIIFETDSCNQLHYSFVSNATLLTQKMIEKLASKRIGWIDISLDSCFKETYEKIRKGANFSKVQNNLRNLISMRDARKINKFDIYCDYVIQPFNYSEIADFVSFCISLQVIPNFTFVDGHLNYPSDRLSRISNCIEEGIMRATELKSEKALRNLNQLRREVERAMGIRS